MRKTIVGVMGPGDRASSVDLDNAYQLGKAIAQKGWVLLTGGRKVGVMDAASRGAKAVGGLTVGILPTSSAEVVSEAVDIAIVTDLGNARNNINVLSSDVVIACGMGIGTASEVALALKNGKKAILLTRDPDSQKFFSNLSPNNILLADCPDKAIALAQEIIQNNL